MEINGILKSDKSAVQTINQPRHSDDMQDIITAVPSWLLRWGISLFFGVLVLIIALGAMIRYPDIVKAQLKIESFNPPLPVFSKISGKLIKLFVYQGDTVKAGQVLAYIGSVSENNQIGPGKYLITAPQAGKVSFAGIVEENKTIAPDKAVFYIAPMTEDFFGEMSISQNNIGKVKEGQEVLVKLRSYPFEEYGMIRGRIKYIAEVPYKDSVFISKVSFKIRNSSDLKKPIHLKQGMMADAEIVTQDATMLQRLCRSFFKIVGNK
jgi:hypothetical protein